MYNKDFLLSYERFSTFYYFIIVTRINCFKNILLLKEIYLKINEHPCFLIDRHLFFFVSINYQILLLFIVLLFLIINALIYFEIDTWNIQKRIHIVVWKSQNDSKSLKPSGWCILRGFEWRVASDANIWKSRKVPYPYYHINDCFHSWVDGYGCLIWITVVPSL